MLAPLAHGLSEDERPNVIHEDANRISKDADRLADLRCSDIEALVYEALIEVLVYEALLVALTAGERSREMIGETITIDEPAKAVTDDLSGTGLTVAAKVSRVMGRCRTARPERRRPRTTTTPEF